MNKYVFERPIMIFANEYNGNIYYKFSQSKKDIDGNYINAYKDCKFKKDVEIPNKTLIKPLQAWESFYQKDGKTYWYVFINEFEIVEKKEESDLEEIDLDDILNSTPSDIDIDSSELPFD